MLNLKVWRDDGAGGIYIIQLFLGDIFKEWVQAVSNCLEHAEAEACVKYPQAQSVNGMLVTPNIVMAENNIWERKHGN